MNAAVIILLVCSQPAAIIDFVNGRYAEPEMTTVQLQEFIVKLADAKLPFVVREIGKDCE